MLAWSLIPQGIGDLAGFLILGSLSAMIFSLSKTGFGSGIGLLAVPIMVYACNYDTRLAAGILLPMLIVADYAALINWWGSWNFKAVVRLLPTTVGGVALAWLVLIAFDRSSIDRENSAFNDWLRLGIGVIALGFVLLHVTRSFIGKADVFRPGRWHTVVAGGAAGFTSTLAHAAGPIIAMYLLPQKMSKRKYVASTALFFWTANQIKLIPYCHLRMINADTLGAGVVLLPAIAVGAVIGKLLHKRVGPTQFIVIVYTLLALTGVHLCWKSVSNLTS